MMEPRPIDLEEVRKEILKELSLRRRWATFLVWSSALIGFLVSRIFVILFPETHLIVFGYHIHHFYYGLVLILLAGAISITYRGLLLVRLSCVLYGLGLGILIDELGLLLTWGNYWAEVTYTIFAVFTILSIALMFLPDFLGKK